MRKRVVLPLVAAVVIGAGVFGAGQIHAQDSGDPHLTIVQKLAQKLGISEDKVKIAFGEIHSERHNEMKANLDQKLTQAVTDGKITDAQKQAILAKFEEMKNSRPENMESFRNMTAEQRRQAMEQKKTELESWAQQNGINLEVLKDLFPHARGKSMMRHW